jgi:putative copper export protein
MRRSAVAEIALAAVVLGITALLVNLPTPGPHTH